jgi:hypothetical protein
VADQVRRLQAQASMNVAASAAICSMVSGTAPLVAEAAVGEADAASLGELSGGGVYGLCVT